MKHIVVGTAGHVDHGKTALIKALTGIDTDRLKEEKERGMSIDIGFAYLNLPSGNCAEIIDVPGHEHFIKNMLAGVGALDLVLFIVAANEGVMPQTREHLDILRLLGVKKGIIVITKTDLVEKDWLDLVTDSIKELVNNTFLKDAPVIYFSSVTGEGIENLKLSIDEITQKVQTKDTSLPFRLPVDRVFKMEGFGTIVTGTLVNGILKIDDEVEILPRGSKTRVRQIQSHKGKISQALAGQRIGVNLAGIKTEELMRGDVLSKPGYLSSTSLIDAHLTLLETLEQPLQNRARIRLYLGTGEFLGRIILLDKEVIKPGEDGLVQFRLEQLTTGIKGDRFIVRLYSPMLTIGGGEILNAHPKKHKRFKKEVIQELTAYEKGTTEDLIEQTLLSAGGGLSVADLSKLINLGKSEIEKVLQVLIQKNTILWLQPGQLLIHKEKFAELKKKILDTLKEFHSREPLKLNVSKEEIRSKLKLDEKVYDFCLDGLIKENCIILEKDKMRLTEHRIRYTPEQEKIKIQIENFYLKEQFTPPIIEEVIANLKTKPEAVTGIFSSLLEVGTLVELEKGMFLHRDSLEKARQILKDYLTKNGSITVSEYRQLLNSSRKYTLPILQYFDTIKFTKRIADKRILA